MRDDRQQRPASPAGEQPSSPPSAAADAPADDAANPSRRRLLAHGGRLLAYAAPLVLLYKPRAAFATFVPYS